MFDKLAAPFAPDRVSWRVGATKADKSKGMALAYIDARDVMQRLDEVCGPGGWQNDYPHADTAKTVCRIGIKVGDEWVWKSDGAGDSDIEAAKGSLSDAFKRAAVRWGIGRYLYDVSSPWVEIEQHGKSYSIKDSEYQKLQRMLGAHAAPAKPAERPPVERQPDDESKLRFLSSIDATLKRFSDPIMVDQWWTSKELGDAIDLHDLTAEEVQAIRGKAGKRKRELQTPLRQAG